MLSQYWLRTPRSGWPLRECLHSGRLRKGIFQEGFGWTRGIGQICLNPWRGAKVPGGCAFAWEKPRCTRAFAAKPPFNVAALLLLQCHMCCSRACFESIRVEHKDKLSTGRNWHMDGGTMPHTPQQLRQWAGTCHLMKTHQGGTQVRWSHHLCRHPKSSNPKALWKQLQGWLPELAESSGGFFVYLGHFLKTNTFDEK